MIDRIERLEKSDRNIGIAIWALVAGLTVVAVSLILTQSSFVALFV